jgi:hypothetical protein
MFNATSIAPNLTPPQGTPLLETIKFMLKHFSGTPDSIPEDEEGYKRAMCRLQLIGEHSSGRLLLDGPVLLRDPVHPIVKFLGDPVPSHSYICTKIRVFITPILHLENGF